MALKRHLRYTDLVLITLLEGLIFWDPWNNWTRAFPGPGTGPLSGPGRGFKFFSGIRVLTGPGLDNSSWKG